jgi:hypothetical protein
MSEVLRKNDLFHAGSRQFIEDLMKIIVSLIIIAAVATAVLAGFTSLAIRFPRLHYIC